MATLPINQEVSVNTEEIFVWVATLSTSQLTFPWRLFNCEVKLALTFPRFVVRELALLFNTNNLESNSVIFVFVATLFTNQLTSNCIFETWVEVAMVEVIVFALVFMLFK